MTERMAPSADPPALSSALSVNAAAAKVLAEALALFTVHLTALSGSDDPEVVHQARVAWRRFKSGLKLFKPALKHVPMPSLTPLQHLLQGLSALRDFDVALTETLPQWRSTYIEGSPKTSAIQTRRRRGWRQMSQALQRLADVQRSLVRRELARPAVVTTLLALTEWVDGLSGVKQDAAFATVPLQRWAQRRLDVWHARFKTAFKSSRHGANPKQQHRVRIWAKRLRYGVDALGFLLPAQRSHRWRQQAAEVQTKLGAERDLLQARTLAAHVAADDDILTFLQGLADRAADQSS